MLAWSDLRVFLILARERTLARAAHELGVNASTVGRRLRALENAARTRLFEKTPEGYVLTAAARAVVETLGRIEAEALEVERRLLGRDDELAGHVRLATSDSLATWFVVPHLPALRRAHPGLVIELVTGNQPIDLARREADVSLRMQKPTQPQLVARRAGVGAWALYAAESYLERHGTPHPRRHLAGHDLVGFDPELAGTVGARWLATRARKGRVVLTTNSLTAHAEAVAAGLGISALPCVWGDRDDRLRRLPPGVIGHFELWLVVHPDVRENARIRAVLTFLGTLLDEQRPLLAGESGGRANPRRLDGRARGSHH